MMDSLSKCFNRLQERYENVLESKPNYIDDLEMTLPLNNSDDSVESTKKSRCLQRAKRIDRSLRFKDDEDEEKENPVAKPRKVVRFQLENNKIVEPKKSMSFDLDHELIKPKEKLVDEKKNGLDLVEGDEKVVRVKIKMTKQEAQRLLSKCKNDSVFDLEHLVDQIAHVPIHQLQVAMVVVGCNNERQEKGCWLSKLE